MKEKYLEWLFLRDNVNYWINNQFPKGEDVYMFQGKEYDIDKMKARYIELTKQLFKEYEL
jgi:hypothetical protein